MIDPLRTATNAAAGAAFDLGTGAPPSVDALMLELAAERARADAAEAALARAQLVADAMSQVAAMLDHEDRVRQLARVVIPALGDWCAIDLLEADGRFRRVAVEHRDADPVKVALAHELDQRYPEDPASPTGRSASARRRAAMWVPEITDEMIVAGARDAEHARMVRALGLRSYVIAPLIASARVLGTLTLVTAESGRHYTAQDVALIEDLARRTARLIEVGELHSALRDQEATLAEQQVELELQATQLQDAMTELELANETLQDQTVEMEATNQQLHEQQRELEQQAEHLERLLQEATVAREQAQSANRAKADFLAMMSHELRTPLNAIAGYIDLLEMELRGPLTGAQRDDLQRIRRAQLQLLSIISDILNFARLEQGKLEFHIAPVAVAPVLEDLTAIMTPQLRARGLSWDVGPVDAALRVQADPERLAQVLLNLAQNASKFTANGSIALAVEERATTVAIHVRDTGCGIAPERLATIWEPFVQVDRHRTFGGEQGLGLGLAISRELARAMSGELTAVSVVGAGSTFTLELPRA